MRKIQMKRELIARKPINSHFIITVHIHLNFTSFAPILAGFEDKFSPLPRKIDASPLNGQKWN